MTVSNLAMFLLAILCFLHTTYGLLYGLVPEQFLVKIERLRLLQEQEQHMKQLQEAEEQQLYFQMPQHHKKMDALTVHKAANELDTISGKHKLEIKSTGLLFAMKNALFGPNPSPSFKYNFIG